MGIDHLDNDQTQWSLNGNGLQGTFNGELTTSAKLFGGKRAGDSSLPKMQRTYFVYDEGTYVRNDDDGANGDDDSDEDGDGKGDDGDDGGDDGDNDDDAG